MSDAPYSFDPTLADLGWSEAWRAAFGELGGVGFEPARVVRVDREFPMVATAGGLVRAEPAVHLVKTRGTGSRAVVGDWVALSRPEGHDLAIIEAILPRKTAFTRKDPGEATGEQVLIANIDVVFVVQSLSGRGLNVRRLERELVLAWESGARPVVILSKADVAEDTDYQRKLAAESTGDVPIIIESAISGEGLEEVRAQVPVGTTAALLGGSGVGKSTLINGLVGEEVQRTGHVRERDDKGRHITVARELVQLPGGGIIIDTPGMRGLALWDAGDGIASAFPDIDALSQKCRFRDCTHNSEPGCAVIAAVEAGLLPARRLQSYRLLQGEMVELGRKQDERAWAAKEQASKVSGKAAKRFFKDNQDKRTH
ncbi:MAG: ribosome small subunit-dependent GTPase A [Coriobacteriia bacterium]|nr:ribosome small subunit-dependent GTPase A [Coriobacteriia bacterium]